MDFRNNAVSVDKVTATDVNKAIQRSTAKAIAMHGLGLSLWTGEDVPEMVASAPQPVQIEPLKKGTEAWTKVTSYIDTNKIQGVDKLIPQIERKYTLTPAIKKELITLITK